MEDRRIVRESGQLDRREFGREAALALLGGAVVTLSACSGDGAGSPVSPTAAPAPAPAPTVADSMAAVSNNHGHQAVITGAQLTAGNGLQLDMRGEADHSHVADLSAAQIAQVRAGNRVAVGSTDTLGHTHAVVFNGQPVEDDVGYD